MGPNTLDDSAALQAPPDDEDTPGLPADTLAFLRPFGSFEPSSNSGDSPGKGVRHRDCNTPTRGGVGDQTQLPPDVLELIIKKRKMEKMANFPRVADFQLWLPPAFPQ